MTTTARAQNVGIGTTAPTQTLDVNGSLRLRAAAGTGPGRLLGVADDGTLQAQPPLLSTAVVTAPQPPLALGSAVSTGGSGPYSIVVNPAGTRAFVVNSTSNTLQAFDLSSSQPVPLGSATGTGGSNPTSLAVNPAGTRVFVVNAGTNTLQTFDVTNGQAVALGSSVATGQYPAAVAVNPPGTRAFVLNSYAATLQAYDISSGQAVALGSPVRTDVSPFNLAINAAGTRAFVVCAQSIQAYDISSGQAVALGSPVSAGSGGQAYGIALNPAGTRAFVLDRNTNTLQAFTISTGQPVALGAPIPTGGRGLGGLALNPTASRLLVVGQDSNILQTFSIAAPPQVVVVGSNGALGSTGAGSLGDNLGNHTATQNLNLATYQLVGNGGTILVGGTLVADANGANTGTTASALVFGSSSSGEGLASKRTSGGNQYGLDFYTASTNRLSVTVGGNVGIGTSSPAVPLDIVGGQPFTSSGTYGYYSRSGSGQGYTATLDNVSVRASGRVVALEFNASSDARLKRVLGFSDGARDLALLRQVRITDYQLRDSLRYGPRRFKKVIAQQVEQVFPQAVTQLPGFLPDVYARAQLLGSLGDSLRLLTLPAGLAGAGHVGQRLRLLTPQGEVVATLAQAASAGSRQLRLRGAGRGAQGEVFAFGFEHPDVRAVDYEALAMLSVSATQELARKVAVLEQQNATLRQQQQATRTAQQADHVSLETLQAELARLREAVLPAAQAQR